MFQYRIVGLEQVDLEQLDPHPSALAMPIDPDDAQRIGTSVAACHAVLVPLLVSANTHPNGSAEKPKHWIYEGVHRWRAAKSSGHATAPCLLVETNDPPKLVQQCALARRKLTNGMRLLAWLQEHWERVEIEPHRPRDDTGQFAEKTGVLLIRDICRELKCSDKDVTGGMALLRAMQTATDPKTKARLQQVYGRVMIGRMPLRRVRAAAEFVKELDAASASPAARYRVLQRRLTQLQQLLAEDWRTFDRRQKAQSVESLEAILRLVRRALAEVGRS